MRVASAGLVYWVARFFLLGTKARILGLTVSLIILKRSLVFPSLFFYFFAIDHYGRLSSLSLLFFETLHSNGYYLSFSPLPFTSLFFTDICKASSDSHFVFLHFFFLGMIFIPASCTMAQTSVHSPLGTLSDLIPGICLSLLLYNHKGFDLGHT